MTEHNDKNDGADLDARGEERDYLLGRAGDHRRLGEMADEAELKMIHARFQQLYEARAKSCSLVDRDQ